MSNNFETNESFELASLLSAVVEFLAGLLGAGVSFRTPKVLDEYDEQYQLALVSDQFDDATKAVLSELTMKLVIDLIEEIGHEVYELVGEEYPTEPAAPCEHEECIAARAAVAAFNEEFDLNA